MADGVSGQLADQFASFKPTAPAAAGKLITGISIPIKLNHDGGNLRAYLHLSDSVLASPETLKNTLDQIGDIFELDVWRPSSDSGQGFKAAPYKKRY